MMNTSLLQKSGLATLQVAQILAGLEPGDRIPTVTELSEQCEMARGNIQIALNNLKQNHVIRLESHGQNGTIATEIDYVAMAQYCSNTGLTCVMPMPYGLRYEGLASGLYEELNQKGVTGAIAFMRGSGYRLNCVEEGRFHLCVMSQLAFEHYAQEGKDIQLIGLWPAELCGTASGLCPPGLQGRLAELQGGRGCLLGGPGDADPVLFCR